LPQFGFFFDQSRCYNCHTCAVACRNWNNLEEPAVKWMRVYRWEEGSFPQVDLFSLAIPCYHCEDAPCVKHCPYGVIYKEQDYGAVLVDEERCASSECNSRACFEVCPYGAMQFKDDDSRASATPASKCTMCIDRLKHNLLPICVTSCPSRALDFGPIAELEKKYGANRDIKGIPESSIAKPAIIFKPREGRKDIIPYDVTRALDLLARRENLPKVYDSPADVKDIPRGVVNTNKLVLKPKTREELMRTTKNDYG